MQISADYVRDFQRQLEALNKSAEKVVISEEKSRYLTKRLQDGDAEAVEEVISLLNRLCGAYNRVSAALTCRFYDGIREASNVGGDFKAKQYSDVAETKVTREAKYYAESVAIGANDVPLSALMTGVISGELKRASETTMLYNARRDPAKPKWAIVASPGACAFCQMRASNGYQYPRRASVESHTGCTCAAVQVYPGQKIQGYDPNVYLDKYNRARELVDSSDVPKDIQERIDHAKEIHNKKRQEQLEAKKRGEDVKVMRAWGKTNETLIAMRYQDGLK